MNNAELITALRNCSSPTVGSCMDCPYYKGVSCKWQMMEDAADALEMAEKRIAELEAQMPKWISVKDRLPEKTKNVLAANNRGKQWDIDKAWYNGLYFDRCGKKPLFHVTHWMPLPDEPEVEG